MTTTTPAWFIEATQATAQPRTVDVRGATIHYRVWNPGAERLVVLLHGAAANTHWWDHVAPFIAQGLRVVALDLSGHGDSPWRERYTLNDWAHELAAVIDGEKADGNCVVVAHSMGGIVAHQMLYLGLKTLRGLVILDAPMHQRSPEQSSERMSRSKPTRVFDSRTEAVRAYRARPQQLVTLPYIKHYVAEKSLRPVEGGWTWKFDPNIYSRDEHDMAILRPLPCRGVLVRSGQGSIDAATLRMMLERWEGTVTSFDIPDAGHHLMFDAPLALLAAVQATLHGWGFASP